MPVDLLFLPAKKPSTKTLLFVNGSGEDKDTYKNFQTRCQKLFQDMNMCAFSYTKNNEDEESLMQIIMDLQVVLTYLIHEKKQESVSIWATSMGAFPTCKILGSNKFSQVIDKVMLCDPADYEGGKFGTWSGSEEYSPTSEVGSNWLKAIKSNLKMQIVHFTLQNYGKDRYVNSAYEDRGGNHEKGFSRLNTEMVKSFWSKLPEENKDKYIEHPSLPHGILRDGNIERNTTELLSLITGWLE